MFLRETGAIGAAEQELQPGASFTDPSSAQAVGDMPKAT